MIDKRTLELRDAALDAIGKDMVPRVEELARKSTDGSLMAEDHDEYAQIVRMNDTMSETKVDAKDFRSLRIVW